MMMQIAAYLVSNTNCIKCKQCSNPYIEFNALFSFTVLSH